jgi:hypothetical protein
MCDPSVIHNLELTESCPDVRWNISHLAEQVTGAQPEGARGSTTDWSTVAAEVRPVRAELGRPAGLGSFCVPSWSRLPWGGPSQLKEAPTIGQGLLLRPLLGARSPVEVVRHPTDSPDRVQPAVPSFPSDAGARAPSPPAGGP